MVVTRTTLPDLNMLDGDALRAMIVTQQHELLSKDEQLLAAHAQLLHKDEQLLSRDHEIEHLSC